MLAAGVFERAQHQGSTTAVLQMAWQILPGHGTHTTLVGTGHRQPWALVLVTLKPEAEAAVSSPILCHLPHNPSLSKDLTWMVSKTNSLLQ